MEYDEYQVIPEIILCRLGGGGGVVRYRGRVKGDLGRLFRCVNSEIKAFSVTAIPAQVRRRRREGVVRYRGRVKGEFGAKKGSFLLFHWCPY